MDQLAGNNRELNPRTISAEFCLLDKLKPVNILLNNFPPQKNVISIPTYKASSN